MIQRIACFLFPRTNRLLIVCVLLLFSDAALSAQSIELDLPGLEFKKGEEHVLWRKSIELPSGAKIKNAIRVGNACYFASVTESHVWLLKIDDTGSKQWERKLDSDRMQDHVIMLPRKPTGTNRDMGVDVAFSNVGNGNLRVASFDEEGKSEGEKTPGMQDPTGAIRLSNGDVLFMGHTPYDTRETPQGLAARTNAQYKLVWGKAYSPSAEFPKKRPRTIHHASFSKAVVLPDDTIALLGQAGVYSKFGTGESRLWILKIDNKGNKISEAFVDQSYFNAYSNLPVRTSDSELLVRHWKVSSDPFAESDVSAGNPESGIWPWVSHFDFDLNVTATHELGEKLPPNTATAGGFKPSIFPMSGASMYGGNLLLRHANNRGVEVQRVEIGQPGPSLIHWGKLDFPHGTLWIISERESQRLHLAMVKSP